MNNRWLHRFAMFTAAATLVLLAAGGLVTSHEAGLAVPDWPNSYGYNMFFFPVSQWVGGVFYEHVHRLAASGVGLLTTILALWLYGTRARPVMRWAGSVLLVLGVGTAVALPRHGADGLVLCATGLAILAASFGWPRCEPSAPWLRRLGLAAFLAVVLQGVLGGLRVVLFKDQLGIFHAALAQVFFVLLCLIALFTSRWWEELGSGSGSEVSVNLPAEAGTPYAGGFGVPALAGKVAHRLHLSHPGLWLPLLATALILVQLILGATMRHQHAGLAIPDFPLAYGRLWPAMDPASVARYNQQRIEVMAVNPITAFQIGLQMAHRLMAVAILGAVAGCAWRAWRRLGGAHVASRLALAWLGLIVAQALLGAATIWSGKAADIATAHVLVGALSLALGAVLSAVSLRSADFSRLWVEYSHRPDLHLHAALSRIFHASHETPTGRSADFSRLRASVRGWARTADWPAGSSRGLSRLKSALRVHPRWGTLRATGARPPEDPPRLHA